nr:MAG TPA: tail tubular protein [Caudoviricetes sp.]
MRSVVDICNLALSYLGDSATVTSINPPEGSAQAEHCARYFPHALQAVLEAHPWGFATKRIKPALLADKDPAGAYHYALPHDALAVFAVLPPDAVDDYEAGGHAVPVEYQLEREDGQIHILTNQRGAVVRYLATADDPALYPATFVDALVWKLAGMLAGSLRKGDAGAAEAKRCQEMYAYHLRLAIAKDSEQRRIRLRPQTPWMQVR